MTFQGISKSACCLNNQFYWFYWWTLVDCNHNCLVGLPEHDDYSFTQLHHVTSIKKRTIEILVTIKLHSWAPFCFAGWFPNWCGLNSTFYRLHPDLCSWKPRLLLLNDVVICCKSPHIDTYCTCYDSHSHFHSFHLLRIAPIDIHFHFSYGSLIHLL